MNTAGDFQPGADPRRGAGKKGRSGRPTNEVRDLMARMMRKAKWDAAVLRVLTNPEHLHFAAMSKLAMAYRWGQPKQSLALEGGDAGAPALTVVVKRAADAGTP